MDRMTQPTWSAAQGARALRSPSRSADGGSERRIDAALAPTTRRVIVELADVIEMADRAGIPAPSAAPQAEGEGLTALFQPTEAQGFREAWGTVQAGFVDDPKGAVHLADGLVAQVLQSLEKSFLVEQARRDGEDQTEAASTEDLRIALRRYRSFLQRLLAF